MYCCAVHGQFEARRYADNPDDWPPEYRCAVPGCKVMALKLGAVVVERSDDQPPRYAGCPIPTCCGVTMRIAELVDAVECVTCKRVVTALELIAERDAEWDRISTCEQWQSVDLLDVEYEGVTLRKLLQIDLEARQEIGGIGRSGLSPYQRAVVAAHWSAELRSRVAAAKAKERERVVLDADPEDL